MTWLSRLEQFAAVLVNRNSAEDVATATADLHAGITGAIEDAVAAALAGAATGGLKGAETAAWGSQKLMPPKVLLPLLPTLLRTLRSWPAAAAAAKP